ncbi:MAG: ATP-binding protein [Deltaproteobacteria bacterium]|nr:ATP-binding protein [Deltaproteobacteria bacterium]MBW2532533.1 ATP-binding protein [Deltaproteobacteria bacterium]
MLARSERALLLFDEIEDVFPRSWGPMFEARAGARADKAWINRTLERNRVPAVWVANQIDQIDRAFIRRFDLVVEFPQLPPAARRKVLERHTRRLGVSKKCLDRLEGDTRLRAGHIQRAARATRMVTRGSRDGAEQAFLRILEGNVTAEGIREKRKPVAKTPIPYDVSLVNASLDLEGLTAGLDKRPSASLCFYGPSGTGKTAGANHIASALEKPLLCHSASDLLSKWVGGTEENLARMFREAAAQGAVLLLDEADSFLQDRGGARNSWEITQVNELLVQMEAFDGVFICATNLMDVLDRAVFRRFAAKVRFDPPTADQRWQLLLSALAQAEIRAPKGAAAKRIRSAIDRLEGVTHGDFATVVRRARLMDTLRTPQAVIDALGEELRTRGIGHMPRIGFGA